MGLGGLLAVNLVVAAFFLVGRGDEGAPPLPTEIERITPARSAVVRPFEDIGADLADDQTGVLLLDGTELAEDQLKRVEELGQVIFRPGPGQDPEKLSPGFHTATVLYWRQDATRDQARSYTWSFKAG